jgi:hypothetical protein
LFVYVRSDSDSYGRIGFDDGSPYDGHDSSDEVTWVPVTGRYWIRVGYAGETVGDLPVSGTVNVIDVPSATTSAGGVGDINVPSATETTLLDIKDVGELLGLELYITYANSTFKIFVDDVQLNFLGRNYLNVQEWYDRVGVCTGIPISLVKYDDTNKRFTFQIFERWQFRRSFKVTVIQSSGSAQTARASVRYRKLS